MHCTGRTLGPSARPLAMRRKATLIPALVESAGLMTCTRPQQRLPDVKSLRRPRPWLGLAARAFSISLPGVSCISCSRPASPVCSCRGAYTGVACRFTVLLSQVWRHFKQLSDTGGSLPHLESCSCWKVLSVAALTVNCSRLHSCKH